MSLMRLRRTKVRPWIKRLPRKRHVRGTFLHRMLGEGLFRPEYWHPERHTVAGGLAWGSFWALIPIPFQTVPAVLCAYACRLNLPAAVISVWVTNPFTTPLIVYWQYLLGQWILGRAGAAAPGGETVMQTISHAPLPFAIGCVVSAVIVPLLVYTATSLLWKRVAVAWWHKHGQPAAVARLRRFPQEVNHG